MTIRWGLFHFALIGCVCLSGSVWAQQEAVDSGSETDLASGQAKASSAQVTADPLDTSWNHNRGDIITRFAVDFTAVAGLQEGEVSVSDNLVIGLAGGLGYYPHSRLSTDLDLSASLVFAEEGNEITRLTLTPGTRFYPIPPVYLRLGIPFVMTSPASVNGLLGAGYEIPLGESMSLMGEIDVVYPFTGDGDGIITIGGGTSYTF
ncbi:MAG: hypothetical protein JW797_09280 [Bradymonadales bacterium]|nr:hypothetical protein [Bradymonadales bacterium]